MTENISNSQLEMLLRCEFQYAERYGRGIKKPPRSAMSFGSAFHEGTLFNLSRKIDSGKDLPTSEVVEVAITGLEIRADETEWDDEPLSDCKDGMVGLIEVFQEESAPSIQPAAVEEEVRVGFTGKDWQLLMYRDVREVDNTTHDLKTAGRSWPKGRELTKTQPIIYTIPDPGESKFVYDVAVRTKTPKTQTITRIVTPEEKAGMLGLLAAAKAAGDQLKADPDRALPTGYGGNLCSKKWCGYWEACNAKWKLPIKD